MSMRPFRRLPARTRTLLRRRFRRLLAESLERRNLLTTIVAVTPTENAVGVATSTNVSAEFDLDVVAGSATAENFVVQGSSKTGVLSAADTTVSAAGTTIVSDPAANFAPGELVHVTATSNIATTGGAANSRVWQFRTASGGSGQFEDAGAALGNNPYQSVGSADVDSDGDMDIVLGGRELWLNDGTGIFTDSGQILGGNIGGNDVAFADIDADGDLDFVVGARVMINDGNGIFSNSNQNLGGGSATVGDLDGDGDLDVMTAVRYAPNQVWFNNGSGNFSNSGQAIGNGSTDRVLLGDLDGDGDLDAFEALNGVANVIWINDGSGVFSSSGQSLGGFRATKDADLGDIDGDGDLDVITGNVYNSIGGRVYVNDGDGVFVETGQVIGGPTGQLYSVNLADIDGDDDLDFVAFQRVNGGTEIWTNDGTGTFTDSGQRLTFGTNLTRRIDYARVGDIDSDGDLDLVEVNFRYVGGTRIWINQNLTPNVTLSVDNASVAEDGGVATVTATLSAVHTDPVTIDLETTGTASSGDDYTLSATQIVIASGETTGTVTVTAVQDAVDEPDETAIVAISAVQNGQELGDQEATITILDDDEPAPVPDVTLSVDNASIAEDGGVATFTVTLSEVTTVPVTVELGVSGSAAASDFALSATEVVVSAGETSGSVTVTAVQDGDDEADETVTVEIIAVTNGTELGTQEATTAIADDDEPVVPDVSLSVDNASIPEDGGVATFTATLSETTTVDVTVNLESSGAATAGDDYTLSGTQVVIAAGETSGSVTVTAVQDEFDEPDESVVVSISGVTNGNEDGEQSATTNIADDDEPTGFAVTELTPTSTGFQAAFTNPIDAADLNLYDTQAAGMGEADATLTGDASGPIQGSLLVTGPRSVQFIVTGGPLAADTYTVELRSAADGFEDDGGLLLDGNGDGTGGDNFTSSFVVEEPAANSITIGIPDVVRGPGQDVNLPADTELGIPLTISNGDNVRAIDLRISYDPSLLTITGASAGEDAPGATPVLNTTTPGLAILVFFSSNSLPAGEGTFVNLSATVPSENASETYRAQQVLDVHNVVISDGNDNEFPVVVDDALHVNTFFADVSGNGRINAADAAGVARIAALIDSGFGTLLSTDPTVVGDISGNGRLNAADASLVAQFAALIPVPQIPAVPGDVTIAGVPNPGEEGTEDRGGSQAGLLDAVSDDLTFRVVDNFVSQSADSFDTDAVDSAVADGDDFLGDLLEDLL